MRANKDYKNRVGIYQIRNLIDGKVYVGKTTCMYSRCKHYLYDFEHRRTDQINRYMLSSMIKHGINNFEFSPLQFCEIDELEVYELAWMIQLQATTRKFGYNLRMDSSTKMIAHPDTSEKIRNNLRRQWADGVRAGHSDKLKAKWAQNPARREAQRLTFYTIRTKYQYHVTLPSGEITKVDFAGLDSLGLRSALSSFSRHSTDSTMIKGISVTRVCVK